MNQITLRPMGDSVGPLGVAKWTCGRILTIDEPKAIRSEYTVLKQTQQQESVRRCDARRQPLQVVNNTIRIQTASDPT